MNLLLFLRLEVSLRGANPMNVEAAVAVVVVDVGVDVVDVDDVVVVVVVDDDNVAIGVVAIVVVAIVSGLSAPKDWGANEPFFKVISGFVSMSVNMT